MKIIKRISIIIVAVILAISIILMLPVIFFNIAYLFTPVARPEITYGEFPFTLVYEIEGEVITINDVYVCNFDGFTTSTAGKFREWKGYLKSNGDEDLFITEDDKLEIYINIGAPAYFMGDEHPYKVPMEPHIYYLEKDPEDIIVMSKEELCEQFNIKILEWDFPIPITNTFK